VAELPLSAAHLKAEIERSGFMPAGAKAAAKQAEAKKRARSAKPDEVGVADSDADEVPDAVRVSTRRLATVLELLLHKTDVRDEHKLLGPVCVSPGSSRVCVVQKWMDGCICRKSCKVLR
jgi:hypothetical protein